MADTYYNSSLTAAQIEAALTAINGVIAPANNGKILAIQNGTLVPKSVTDYIDLNLQQKTVTPNISQQNIVADAGYNGLSSVVVNGDSDLIAGNIKNGITIFGVTGNYSGGDAELLIASAAVENNTYINTGMSSAGTPYISDGKFAATAESYLEFSCQSFQIPIIVEFDLTLGDNGKTIFFGGSETNGGAYSITPTTFSLYARSSRFSETFDSSLTVGGEYHIRMLLYSDKALLYVDDDLVATGNSNYCNYARQRILNGDSISILSNPSSRSAPSNSKINNMSIKVGITRL